MNSNRQNKGKIFSLIIIIMTFICINNFTLSMANDQIHSQVPSKSIEDVSNTCFENNDPFYLQQLGAFTATSGECYYLYPYVLHLTSGSTSSVPLVVIDASGNNIGGSINFYGYNSSLISISPDGYVTALRQELSNEIGTWVHATIDGQDVIGTCIVRVLSQDYGIPYAEVEGANTALYYPTSVNGENLSTYVNQYQIPTVNEYAYTVQSNLMGLLPFNGCRQIFEVDFGETEQQRVCGISGNPIRLGWNINGNDWQNCFLVPFIPPRSPHWFVLYHEMGHNFTWASNVFARGLGTTLYSESMASTIEITTLETLINNPSQFVLNSGTRNSMQIVVNLDSDFWLDSFQDWLNSGADFSLIDAHIICGLWLNYKNAGGSEFATRFFLLLNPQYESRLSTVLNNVQAQGENGKHTFFAALISSAMNQDLYSEFANTYHFPINQSLFNQAYQELWNILYDDDDDNDGIPNYYDNCPKTSNPNQEDTYPPQGNGIGDACDCEGDFDCSGGVDAADVDAFLADFGRSQFINPCTNLDPCNGDFNCDVNVDAADVTTFLEDFGRSQFNNPCPDCVAGDWCSYE